jgi:hypothetical protein
LERLGLLRRLDIDGQEQFERQERKNKMKKNFLLTLIAALFIIGTAAACVAPTASAGDQALPEVSPQEVAQSFYNDYQAMDSSLLSEDAYKTNPYLNADAVKYIDEVVAGFGEGGAYDPFICAQDMPDTFTAAEAVINGSQAVVEVESSWGTRTKVTLDVTDGEWKISKIECLH